MTSAQIEMKKAKAMEQQAAEITQLREQVAQINAKLDALTALLQPKPKKAVEQ